MLEIKLSSEIMESVRKGFLKTKELITFILDTVPEATILTTGEIEKVSLKDISFNGKYAINANIDMYRERLIVKLAK